MSSGDILCGRGIDHMFGVSVRSRAVGARGRRERGMPRADAAPTLGGAGGGAQPSRARVRRIGTHRGGGEALDLVDGRIREVSVELGDAAGRGGGHGGVCAVTSAPSEVQMGQPLG